ncbi:MAG: hypothetical protein NZZ41_03860, partial [Candidatus Dojkabacteria bacterium]|nr:hypothetical protein [Candidatus Dojkabacteria bacterium]
RPANNPAPAINATWGDLQSFSIIEQANGTNDCSFSVLPNTVNGIGSISVVTVTGPTTSCIAFIGSAATVPHATFNAQNLPLVIMKVRPSALVPNNVIRIGLGDTVTATNTDPNEGIYFTNIGGVWAGVTRSAGISNQILCVGQNISITSFALLKIETTPTNVRFYVDNNVNDGVQWNYCGASNVLIPTMNLTAILKWTATGVGHALYIDYFRVWQDDSDVATHDNTISYGMNDENSENTTPMISIASTNTSNDIDLSTNNIQASDIINYTNGSDTTDIFMAINNSNLQTSNKEHNNNFISNVDSNIGTQPNIVLVNSSHENNYNQNNFTQLNLQFSNGSTELSITDDKKNSNDAHIHNTSSQVVSNNTSIGLLDVDVQNDPENMKKFFSSWFEVLYPSVLSLENLNFTIIPSMFTINSNVTINGNLILSGTISIHHDLHIYGDIYLKNNSSLFTFVMPSGTSKHEVYLNKVYSKVPHVFVTQINGPAVPFFVIPHLDKFEVIISNPVDYDITYNALVLHSH